MAHECFEDQDVATQMNTQFVNIKVDREERPDVDAVYMEAVQAMTGRGGWPMTVFMTPDAKPFYGGTYFPKPSFLQLMTAITDVWENRREDIDTNVEALMQALQRSEFAEPANAVANLSTVTSAVTHLVGGFDSEWGGFGAAPKFPSTMNIDLLLRSNSTHANALHCAEGLRTARRGCTGSTCTIPGCDNSSVVKLYGRLTTALSMIGRSYTTR